MHDASCHRSSAASARPTNFFARTLHAFALSLLVFSLLPTHALAQESSSVPNSPSAASGALSQALSAACSQSQIDFARFLTARNKQSFARMTPAARVALMKRFVLLSEPGKPSISLNPSGRPTVHCETPIGAADIQIGGADEQDNMAFLPVELRDAIDPAGADAVRVNMGLVRENGQWRLLSLGLVLLDLPSLEIEWNAAEISSNESAALESLKLVAQSIETYRRTYTHLPESLDKLGPPPPAADGKVRTKPSQDAAALLEADLAAGKKDGYAFRYVILGASSLGAVAQFELAASPAPYGQAGRRSFFRDATGAFHAGDHRGAVGSATDPKAE
jgi:hypothetical protein